MIIQYKANFEVKFLINSMLKDEIEKQIIKKENGKQL
jgi:hypothetical protein